MNNELRTVASISTPPSNIKERRKRFKLIFRNLRRISAARLSQPTQLPVLAHDIEPINLGQRIVLRSDGHLPVKRIVGLHKLIKGDSSMASEVLSVLTNGDPTRTCNAGLHSAIRHMVEERLKVTAQLTGIFPSDPDLTRPAQELFEQFYNVHGLPNDAESDLLQAVSEVDVETVDAWFTFKIFRQRGFLTVRQKLWKKLFQEFAGQFFWDDLASFMPMSAKPYSRH